MADSDTSPDGGEAPLPSQASPWTAPAHCQSPRSLGARLVPPTQADLLLLTAVGVVALALFVLARTVVFGQHVSANAGLGADGVFYGRMSRGLPAPYPWGQRFVLPDLIHLMHLSVQNLSSGFLWVNSISLALVGIGASMLTRRVALECGASRARAAYAAILAGALLAILPLGFRWIWFDPALVDPFAAALGVWWYLTFTSRSARLQWCGVPLAGLAAAAHQFWAPILVAGTLARMLTQRNPASTRLGQASLASIGLGVYAYLTVPTTGAGVDGSISSLIKPLAGFFGSQTAIQSLVWSALFAFGLLPLVLVCSNAPIRGASAWWWRSHPGAISLAAPMLMMTAACVLESIAVGGDEQRHLFYESTPFILALVLGYCATNRHADVNLLVALLLSMIVWQPLFTARGTGMGCGFFSPQFCWPGVAWQLSVDMHGLLRPILLWALLVAATSIVRKMRSRPAPTTLVEVDDGRGRPA